VGFKGDPMIYQRSYTQDVFVSCLFL